VDWGYAAIGAISYTYEIGFSNFYPAYAGNDGPLAHCQRNREPFILLGETARYTPVTHHVEMSKQPSGPPTGPEVTYGTHSVITGRALDVDGNPVAAELVAERTARVPLGSGGGGGFFDEPSRATMPAGEDGTFAWHLPPSTTPNAKERGEVEAWTVTVEADGRSVSREVVVDRGETADLGDITLE
jgi:hypothetical protein